MQKYFTRRICFFQRNGVHVSIKQSPCLPSMSGSQTESRESSSPTGVEYFELIYDCYSLRKFASAKPSKPDIWSRVVSSTLAISRESSREFSLSLSRRVLSLGNLSPFNSGNDKKRNGIIYDLAVRFSCWRVARREMQSFRATWRVEREQEPINEIFSTTFRTILSRRTHRNSFPFFFHTVKNRRL